MTTRALLIVAVLAGGLQAGETATKTAEADLEIYLPRDTRIDGETLTPSNSDRSQSW